MGAEEVAGGSWPKVSTGGGETTLTPNQIKELLGLEKHPTCGFVAETYRSTQTIPAGALPQVYGSDRPVGSALYFMVFPTTPSRCG